MSLTDKIIDLDPRVIYTLVIILILVPLLRPLGIPIAVGKFEQESFDSIESIPEGTKVLFIQDLGPGTWSVLGPGSVAWAEHLFQKPVKIYWLSFTADGPMMVDLVMNAIGDHGKEYGTDWINIGYVPGEEAGRASFAADIRKTISIDWIEKKSLDEFAIMEGINKVSDFDLIVHTAPGVNTYIAQTIRQMSGPNNLPLIAFGPSADLSIAQAFMSADQMIGTMSGMAGYAAYERLVGRPAIATRSVETLATTQLFAVISIIVGNVLFQVKKYKERAKI